MFTTIADFESLWREEADKTLLVLDRLTDASLAHATDPEGRTIGRLAWHITESVSEMPAEAGLEGIDGPREDSHVPIHARDIRDAYARTSDSFLAALRAGWTDTSLLEEVPMYGETWTKRGVLVCLLMHQAHHRGQLTVLMRQSGLTVPGLYGPTREDWAQMGVPAPAI